eukprot:6089602-Alexandrium_andersonii.AAC.1
MSASLVGSEMCIRDRWASATFPANPFDASGQRGVGHVPGKPPVLGPVSYTHLTLPTICSV